MWLVTLARLYVMSHTRLWREAKDIVARIRASEHIQKAVLVEEMTLFCPRCGQIPDGDRRMEEAREALVERMRYHGYKRLRRSQIDFALTFHFWNHKEER